VIQLLLILLPIALVDSISPVRIGAMVTILCADRPSKRAYAFITTIFVGYFILGVTFAMLGQKLLDVDLVLDPTPVNFVIGLVIGIVLLIVGGRGLRKKSVEQAVEVDQSNGVGGAVVTAAVITAATAPSAIPLLAGVNQILKSPVGITQAYLALLFYCVVYLTPLVSLLVVRTVLGERAEAVMKKLSAGAERWMGRLMAVLFILLGFANVIDALGYFLFNRPLY